MKKYVISKCVSFKIIFFRFQYMVIQYLNGINFRGDRRSDFGTDLYEAVWCNFLTRGLHSQAV